MLNTDLASFFFGPTRHREFAQTVHDWRQTERVWKGSRVSGQDLSLWAAQIVGDMAPANIAEPLRTAAVGAVSQLVRWEDLGQLEVDWETIRDDPVAALRFRQMLARRRRWARKTGAMLEAFRSALRQAIGTALEQAPSGSSEAAAGATFELPLIERLVDPAAVIERMTFAPYQADALERGLFGHTRQIIERNLLAASGLPPTADIRTAKKLVTPAQQRNKSAAELADLYLAGTPLRPLLETPVPLSIPDDLRFQHLVAVAGSGHGKTQFLQYLIHADLLAAQRERRSIVVIDSQGDLISRLVRLRLFAPDEPGSLADKLILIDPADVEHPPSLNLFDAHLGRLATYRPADRERVLNGVVELYETLFSDLLGAELTQKQGVVFKYLARLMITIPGATIHTLMKLMENGQPFREHMARLEGSARFFFETEFFHLSFAATKKQILRRLWGLLATPSFERMFAQPTNKLDLFGALQDGSIILVNTAKELLKTEGSQLFGRFVLKLVAQAGLERSTISPAERTPTMVYVDEAHEYFDDTVETILAQARKYRIGLATATQSMDTLSPRLRAGLLANTSIKCAGGVSARDARALADELRTTPEFIESMRRDALHTEFAVSIRGLTPHAVRLPVPLGHLEQQPILSEEAFSDLIQRNHARYCGTLDEVGFAVPSDEPSANLAGETYQPVEPEPTAPDPRTWSAERPIRRSRTRMPTSELGRGGPQHRYVQHLIKRLAEERGFRAVIEEQVEGGQVDVALHRDDFSVACEISVTSAAGYEAQNLAKCLRSKFGRVWAVLVDPKRRRLVEEAAQQRLAPEDLARVEFLTVDELVGALDAFRPAAAEENEVLGYKVTVTRRALTPREAKEQRAAIARILSQSSRRSDGGAS